MNTLSGPKLERVMGAGQFFWMRARRSVHAGIAPASRPRPHMRQHPASSLCAKPGSAAQGESGFSWSSNLIKLTDSKRNSYQCTTCSGIVFTADQDEGTTPFMMKCRATDGCTGTMESAFYRLPEQAAKVRPHYIWRRPTAEEYAIAEPGMKQHFDMDGLDLHANPPASRE